MKLICILAFVTCVVKIIITDNPEVRLWACVCGIWVLITLRNNNDNNRNERNQHSINY
nr:MAG TPA: hypothetical protein [Caudoviricetes sp.]